MLASLQLNMRFSQTWKFAMFKSFIHSSWFETVKTYFFCPRTVVKLR